MTPTQILLLICYISLWTSKTLIVRSSQSDGKYTFSITAVVITTEVLKLLVTFIIFFFFSNGTIEKIKSSWRDGVYYAVPAFLYLLVNYLYYYSFLMVDAGTFWIVYQLRILSSGVFFQILFGRQLGLVKWSAILLLVVGCMIHQWESVVELGEWKGVALVLLQCLCSSLSGVYNEFLFKKKDVKMEFSLQNIWLYSFNILFNILLMLFREPQLTTPHLFFQGFSSTFCIINIILTAGGGIATAFMLKYLSAIMKEYGSSLVMIASSIGSIYLLHEKQLTMSTILSLFIVSSSLLLYTYEFPIKKVEETKSIV